MYIESITMREFRTFKQVSTNFLHPDEQYVDGMNRQVLRT